jgi:hypothetical protein
MNDTTTLPTIPIIDVREGGPVRHAIEGCARSRALRDDCLAWFPKPMSALLPVLDGIARRWLRRSRSPYLDEIEAISAALKIPGIWFLNSSYQWGCTTLAREEAGAPWLARTLDWPFPGLGRHADVARMQGAAGEFYSITWAGFVGVLTAMAPGRFAATINQAPMLRRTAHPWLRMLDFVLNARTAWRQREIPPDQLLRQAFETCDSFAGARAMLETTPIARPVIYTLVGTVPGERCVIERTENDFCTSVDASGAANDWHPCRPGWEGRISADKLFSCSFADAAESSRQRRESLAGWSEPFSNGDFGWVTPPVLNLYTRLAVAMCPSAGTLNVLGYEAVPGVALPQPVTQICSVADG